MRLQQVALDFLTRTLLHILLAQDEQAEYVLVERVGRRQRKPDEFLIDGVDEPCAQVRRIDRRRRTGPSRVGVKQLE